MVTTSTRTLCRRCLRRARGLEPCHFLAHHSSEFQPAATLTSFQARFSWSTTDPSTAAFCRQLAADPLRPQYHLLPAHKWMNDPNGPIFFRGQYHMFHQYNPQAAVWGNMNWAHVTSPDLINWQHEPIAISPTPGGP